MRKTSLLFISALLFSNAALALTTIDVKVTGGTDSQRTRLTTIAKNLEPIINNAEFRKRILGAMYNGKIGFESNSLPRATVYDRTMAGDELKKKKPDNKWTMQLTIEKLRKGVYGTMYWPSGKISFNSMYLDARKDSGLGGTLCHEYSHLIGFTHSKEETSTRKYSVPYAIGNLCAELYAKMHRTKK